MRIANLQALVNLGQSPRHGALGRIDPRGGLVGDERLDQGWSASCERIRNFLKDFHAEKRRLLRIYLLNRHVESIGDLDDFLEMGEIGGEVGIRFFLEEVTESLSHWHRPSGRRLSCG